MDKTTVLKIEVEESKFNIICPSEEDLFKNHQKVSKCPVSNCGKEFRNPSSMKMHIAKTHGVGEKHILQAFNNAIGVQKPPNTVVFACPNFNCSRTFGTGKYFKVKSNLRDHYLNAHAEKKYVCKECGIKFGNPNRIQNHTKVCGKYLKCVCGCPFKTKDALLDHSVQRNHELPEELKLELLQRNKVAMLKQRVTKQRGGREKPCTGINTFNAVLFPQHTLKTQPLTSNAILLIPSNFMAEQEKLINAANTSKPKGESRENISAPKNADIHMQICGQPAGTVQDKLFDDGEDKLVSVKDVGILNNFVSDRSIKSSKQSSSSESESLLKTSLSVSRGEHERATEALPKFAPMKKRGPTPMDLVKSQPCKFPRRHYRRKKKKLGASHSDDDASIVRIQNCVLEATQFVERALPVRGMDLDEGNSCQIENGPKSGSAVEISSSSQIMEKCFERQEISREIIEDDSTNCNVYKPQRQSVEPFNSRKVARLLSERKNSDKRETVSGESRSEPFGEYDNLNPELLFLLRNSLDRQSKQKTTISGEVNTQQTQTPVNKTGNDPFSFYQDYQFWGNFDNNDIETQTDDLPNFLSDAFTQTNQQSGKFLPTNNDIQRQQSSMRSIPTFSWLNNNHTQTDQVLNPSDSTIPTWLESHTQTDNMPNWSDSTSSWLNSSHTQTENVAIQQISGPSWLESHTQTDHMPNQSDSTPAWLNSSHTQTENVAIQQLSSPSWLENHSQTDHMSNQSDSTPSWLNSSHTQTENVTIQQLSSPSWLESHTQTDHMLNRSDSTTSWLNSSHTQTESVAIQQFSSPSWLGNHTQTDHMLNQSDSTSLWLNSSHTQTENQQTRNSAWLDNHTQTETLPNQSILSPSWLNNSHTQTDMDELISNAFTQTRASFDSDSLKLKTTSGNISNNQTQTNLSFDNVVQSFSLDDSLDSTLIPDFTDMCTQTNLTFDELLEMASPDTPLGMSTAEAQTVISSSSFSQIESNSSETQTVLPFDDIFEHSLMDGDDTQRNRTINTTYTQTSSIDDMFSNENFTQTI